MKKVIFILNFILPAIIYSQEFNTKFTFHDSKGNTDTLILGYSPNATDRLDSIFGEINLMDNQIDTNFCVFSTVFIRNNEGIVKTLFRTKKQIIDADTFDYRRYASIGIICKNFPLTIKWDRKQFQDTARSKSYLASNIGFDVGDGPYLLKNSDSTLYTIENLSHVGQSFFDSINSKPIKTWILYIGFASNSFDMGISNKENSAIKVFPIPCENSFNIQFNNEQERIIKFFDIAGRLYYNITCKSSIMDINISHLSDNIYILKVFSKNGIYSQKILKHNKK